MKKNWIPVLGKITNGIYLLTTFHKDQINGMIASWVSLISYDPPLIMIAVHPNRYSHQLIEQSGYFALHSLGKRQKDYLARFKGSDPRAKFSSIKWDTAMTGCPIIDDCVAYLECQVTASCRPGNHTIFIGEIVNAQALSEEELLCTIDYDGIYLGKA
ncbi:MAG: flavin reductase family protein [Desulfobacterales bacterium]|jgi:flavin reductase (DIM6/NTAB) family NADH-FMN oxidoreductase RutF